MRNLVRFCIVTMWLCAAGSGTARDGTLRGVVMDFTGALIPNASIRVEHWELDTRNAPLFKEDSLVTTSQDGSYSVSLKPGLYDVFVSFSIFSPVAKKVRVEAATPSEYSPKLQLDPLTKFGPVDVRGGPAIPNDH